jgi:hypothetical protein
MELKLIDFYKSYFDWLSGGAPDKWHNSRDIGLCTAIDAFVYKLSFLGKNWFDKDDRKAVLLLREKDEKVLDAYNRFPGRAVRMCTEMREQFEDAGLDPVYPFGGAVRYDTEAKRKQMHENKMRIRWINARLNNEKLGTFIELHCRDLTKEGYYISTLDDAPGEM